MEQPRIERVLRLMRLMSGNVYFTVDEWKKRARDPLQRLHLTPRYENALTPLNEIKLTPTEKTLQGIFFIVLDSVLAGGV